MPSSTSSSSAEAIYQRPLPTIHKGSAWLAVLSFVLLLVAWEMWVRSQGVTPSYRNSDGLWAEQRRLINQGAGDGWVFTGSSRVLFNLQPAVWEQHDGRRPLQLALEGTSPMSVLEDLAEDDDFTGSVIVGVAPNLFFTGSEYRESAISRPKEETPTQWFGHQVSLIVEPHLAFYNFDYALPTMLRRQPLPEREGVEWRMEVRKLSNLSRDRSSRMWSRVETDEAFQKLAKVIWAHGWKPLADTPVEQQQRVLKARSEQIARAVAVSKKFRAKGVELIFVRMPSEGHYTVSEPDLAPRALAWDQLIEQTGALGLHFQDHPEMQGYWLPEWSHMSASEADRFTKAFYGLVQRELDNRNRSRR
jgi:hypothetical protein